MRRRCPHASPLLARMPSSCVLSPQVQLYDLRSPLGLPPAALGQVATVPLHAAAAPATSSATSTAAASPSAALHTLAALPPPSLLAHQQFLQERAALRGRVADQGRWTSAVQFERVWWDKRAKHPSLTKVHGVGWGHKVAWVGGEVAVTMLPRRRAFVSASGHLLLSPHRDTPPTFPSS